MLAALCFASHASGQTGGDPPADPDPDGAFGVIVPIAQQFLAYRPAVSLTAPANNSIFGAPATIQLAADASSPIGITRVDFYNGTTLIGTSFTNPFVVSWTGVGIGTYVITARAANPYKMTVTSVPIAVTVRANQGPAVTLTTPTNGQSFTAPASIALAAAASDFDGSIAQVEFLSGSTVIAATNVFPYQGSWSDVPAGTYQLAARATDNLGTQTTSTPSIDVVVAFPPTVSLSSPSPNQTVAPGTPIQVSANPATDQARGRGVANVVFAIRNGAGSVVWTLTTYPCTGACGGLAYTGTWTPTASDDYLITATVTDTGSASADSPPVALRVQ